jgi:hypothetical protein
MRGDDLTPLLLPKPEQSVRFRQGTVVAWDANTGNNTIEVGGAFLTNVPILNSGEAIALKAGHVVGLLTWLSSWFILGRITVPGDPEFASASVAFDASSNTASNFAVNTGGPNIVVTTTLDVPAWADEALITVNVTASLHNTRNVCDFALVFAYIEGVPGIGAFAGYSGADDVIGGEVGALSWNAQSAFAQLVVNVSGVPTITCTGRVQANGANWTADALNTIQIGASATFRSTV